MDFKTSDSASGCPDLRTSHLINEDWKFHRGDPAGAAAPEYDDSGWRTLDLPHDWSVEGPYSPDLASATGYLPGGVAWYRKHLAVPAEKAGRRVRIYFEGVYRDAEVFLNGVSLGLRPNGYISYGYDLTPHLAFGGDNVLAVRVDHSKYADSRWYTGSGIYRDVHLTYTDPAHIDLWGVDFRTPHVSPEVATAEVETAVRNDGSATLELEVGQELLDPAGTSVARISGTLTVPSGERAVLDQKFEIEGPKLWSLEETNLYTLRTTISRDDTPIDGTETRVGFRWFAFDPDRGFFLNGKSVTVKGVCLHHDAGSLGAAVPREVWERRLRTLQSLGANAIRTSHNPQAPVLYELCDEMGFLVMDEAYDEWEFPKKKWIQGRNVGEPGFDGHAAFFEEWGEADLRDMIRRDRNHPCIFLWSIGNEVDYPNDPYSHPVLDEAGIGQVHEQGFRPEQPHADRLGAIAHRLADVVRKTDPSRPVTAALAGPLMSNETAYPDALDVVGYNYTEDRYEVDHRTYPERVLYGSENRHFMEDWKAVRDNPFIFGQFLWTGIDYLGESQPWPSRGSTSGLLDLAGYIKPRGRFRQSLWTDEPMVHLGTLPAGSADKRLPIDSDPRWDYREGETVRVIAFTNCAEAELLLDGKSVGERKTFDDGNGFIAWDVPFREGKLEAVAYRDQKEAARDAIETSGPAHALRAGVWCGRIAARRGTGQIEVEIVDRQGRPVFAAENEITCTTEGPVALLGMEAANPTDTGDYRDNRLRAYRGRLIVYVQARGETGRAIVKLSSPQLEGAEATLSIEQ